MPTTDAAVLRHLGRFLRPNRHRLSIPDLEQFAAASCELICECAVMPSALPLLLNPTQPIYCFQVTDDGSVGQHLLLAFSDDGAAGRRWFAVDANAFAPIHLRPLFEQHQAVDVVTELRRVASHFG